MGVKIQEEQRYLARLSVVAGSGSWRAEVLAVHETTLLEAETAAELRRELQACVAAGGAFEVVEAAAEEGNAIHLPAELYRRLELEAQLAGRSLDCWIAGLLQRALDDLGGLDPRSLRQREPVAERERSLVSA